MPNFNSREVAERFREQCVADGLWPMQGDSELEHRLAVFLDSALLAANPGAEELARDLDRVAQFLCIDGENCPACKGIFSRVVNILSAALESARREERRHTGVLDSNGREILDGDIVKAATYTDEDPQILRVYYKNGGYLIDYKDSESDVCLLGWFPGVLEVVDSLAEKEGGR